MLRPATLADFPAWGALRAAMDASHAAHRACGFEETGRVVYFRKSVSR